ncbi:MAG: glycosyltransferase [Planctomycetes bacterium]|jgi:glycosyltransferase involved in cell wall biosynthesis|nr:glycosyltransferase [Planctomycetota bacterium]
MSTAAPLRVLHVVHATAPEARGGVQSYVADLMAEQRAAGDEPGMLTGSFRPLPSVTLARLQAESPVLRLHRDDDYSAWHARAWHPGVAELFTTALREQRPDVVHLHHWLYLSTDLVATAAALGIPTVVTLHDLYVSCPRCYRWTRSATPCAQPLGTAACLPCVPRLPHQSDADVAESILLFRDQLARELQQAATVLTSIAATADLIAATTSIPRQRISVLPFGYRRRLPAGQPRPLASTAPFRFVYLGELSAAKGVSWLLRAFRDVVASASLPVTLDLFGGTEDAAYAREVAELAEGLPVTIRGPYEPGQLVDVRGHVAVLPMQSFQTWCFVLDECRELGLPIIASDGGALRARAADDTILVEPGDTAALAAAMSSVLHDAQLLQRLHLGRPALPPPMADHATALRAVYTTARGAPRPSLALDSTLPALRDFRDRLDEQHRQAMRSGQSTAPR